MSLLQSTFLKALGWSLIDSVWQMGVLWLVYLLITANGKKFDPAARHGLALLSLTGGSLWFLGELVYNLFHPHTVAFTGFRENLVDSVAELSSLMDAVLPLFSVAYLAVSGILFLRLLSQYRHTKSLAGKGLQKIEPSLRLFTRDIADRMNIRRTIQVWLSDRIDSPLTIGFWKPIILLPVAALSQLSPEQTEAVILHELYHIRRNDYLVNLLVAFSNVILFFNPFARLLSIHIRNERENSCDDLVIQFQYSPVKYAQALLLLEQNRSTANLMLINATGSNGFHLLERVRRIITGQPAQQPLNHRMIGLFISFIIIGFLGWFNPAMELQDAMIPSMADGFVRMESRADIVFGSPHPLRQENSDFLKAVSPVHRRADESREFSSQVMKPVPPADAPLPPVPPDPPTARFIANEVIREFSIRESELDDMPVEEVSVNQPYIPAGTLAYTFQEDTAMPKPTLINLSDLKAQESLEKALMALEEIDWIKLKKELKAQGKELDIVKLQSEIRKAISDVDFKKINSDIEKAQSELIFQQNEELRKELETFQKKQSQKQERINQARLKVVQERLAHPDSGREKILKEVVL